MSKPSSPTRFSGESDHFYDPSFTAEISQKMRVPKRIKVDGDSDEPLVNGDGFNHWISGEKLDMTVPEKIVVLDGQLSNHYLGRDEHYGTKSIPRELEFENSIMPPETSVIRVQTPPKVLTLDNHFYSEDFHSPAFEISRKQRPEHNFNETLNTSTMGETSGVEGMTISEEVVHLRKQLAKLNRRVMSIELDNLQRQQREKILYVIGLAYLFIKTVVWLSRSN